MTRIDAAQDMARRTALGVLTGGTLALAAAPGAAVTRTPPSLPLATPADRLRAFLLMRGALDDRVVVGYLDGRYFGCVNGEMTPLFGVVSATFARYRPRADGSVAAVSVEQAYFIDPATGVRLTRYANPYTGQTVEVPSGGYPPSRTVFTPALEMQVVDPQPGMVLAHRTSPFVIEGDDVRLTEVTTATTRPPGGGVPARFHEVVGLHARLSEMTAPGARHVRCETSYTSVKSWRSWLKMDGHPGETVSTGAGLYGASIATLPRAWLAAAREHRPELLADPARVLDPVWRQG